MKHDFLKWAALLAALIATASAEYELARAVGFNQWVAAAVPGALDIYTVRALRAHRDVLAAVTALIAVNAASHLVTAGLLPVNVPLVVSVAAIAPLVLWRVHHLAHTGNPAPAEAVISESLPASKAVSDPVAEVTIDRIDDDQPQNAPAEPDRPAVPVTPPAPALEFRPLVWPPDVTTDNQPAMTAPVPAEQTRQMVTEPVTLTPSELRRRARKLNREAVRSSGRPVTIKALQDELGLSRREATELRREVVGGERS